MRATDFENIFLYVPVAQLAIGMATAQVAGILVTRITGNPVQAAAAMALACIACLRRPARLRHARGADAIFEAIRPAAFVWLLAIVFQELSRPCAGLSTPAASHGAAGELSSFASRPVVQFTIINTCGLVMAASGFVRAVRPNSENDTPFFVSCSALLILVVLLPAPLPPPGPLCVVSGVFDVAERVAALLAFVCAYSALVYAAPPEQLSSQAIFVCACRAAAASVWTLTIAHHFLLLAPVQAALVIWIRLSVQSSTTLTRADCCDDKLAERETLLESGHADMDCADNAPRINAQSGCQFAIGRYAPVAACQRTLTTFNNGHTDCQHISIAQTSVRGCTASVRGGSSFEEIAKRVMEAEAQ